jgi:UDP-3-O-[3-hydroxymyristoyl] glucosamine N-acyltransferase
VRARAAAALVGGQLVGEDRELRTVAPLDRAGPDDLAYATGPLPAGCAAGVLLATRPTAGRTVIVVADPRAAFAKLLHALFPEVHAPGVHPGAFVHPTATLGEGVVVYPGCWVGPGCEIGADTVLFPNVVVYPGTRVGPGCRVHAGAVLGADGFSTVADGGRPLRVPQVGRLVLGARVDVGANTCIDRGALDDTVVEDDVKLDDLVLIGHNCHLGRGALVAGQAGLGGSTSVGAGAVLGGQVGTADHARIGAGARVAAGAGIASRVPAGETWMGRPAGPASRTRRAWAALRHLPELVGDVRALAKRVSSLEQARRDD